MKRMILIAVVLSVGMSLAGWRGRFDEQFAAALNQGTPIPAVAWYKLDGNALDSSGNGRNGAETNGTWNASGKFGGSYTFGTSLSRIAIPFTAQSTTAGTVCWWEKAPRDTRFGISFDTYGGSNKRFVFYANTSLFAELLTDSTSRGTTLLTFTKNQWHHMAIVWGQNKLYIDGVLSADFNDGGLGAGSTTMYLGDRYAGENSSFGGDFDDVRFYNTALSEANIKRIMESQDNEPLEELQ